MSLPRKNPANATVSAIEQCYIVLHFRSVLDLERHLRQLFLFGVSDKLPVLETVRESHVLPVSRPQMWAHSRVRHTCDIDKGEVIATFRRPILIYQGC